MTRESALPAAFVFSAGSKHFATGASSSSRLYELSRAAASAASTSYGFASSTTSDALSANLRSSFHLKSSRAFISADLTSRRSS